MPKLHSSSTKQNLRNSGSSLFKYLLSTRAALQFTQLDGESVCTCQRWGVSLSNISCLGFLLNELLSSIFQFLNQAQIKVQGCAKPSPTMVPFDPSIA